MLKEFKAFDPAVLQRRRINANPEFSLKVFAALKELYGELADFITVETLATELYWLKVRPEMAQTFGRLA